jgi:phenylacetate-CoA ligase
MADLRPDGYIGTPSFLRILLGKGRRDRVTLLAAEGVARRRGVPAALRGWLEARGVRAYQSYGTADLGLVAYETEAREGWSSTKA